MFPLVVLEEFHGIPCSDNKLHVTNILKKNKTFMFYCIFQNCIMHCLLYLSAVGRLRIQLLAPPWDEVARQNDVLKVGGEWSPADCRNTEKLAIVIPYRDREEHLRIFLNHMHPILRRQMITYRVFVVEQVSRGSSNHFVMSACLYNHPPTHPPTHPLIDTIHLKV